jgi:hypothetical protein
VFSLDNNKYQIFEWKNIINNQDLISNNNIIFEQLKNKLIKKYITESKYIINYYNYYKLKYINYPPDKMIKSIINDYKNEKNYDKMPPFILKFFQNIQYDLSYNKNKKIEILSNYDNNEFFMSKLEEVIIESIEEYLGIDNDN